MLKTIFFLMKIPLHCCYIEELYLVQHSYYLLHVHTLRMLFLLIDLYYKHFLHILKMELLSV